jgi:membrane-bound lytic murein transglycosylase A
MPHSNRIALGLALLLFLAGWFLHSFKPAPVPDGLVLKEVTFNDLHGWVSDRQSITLAAFRKSCARFDNIPASRSLGAKGIGGTIADWRQSCQVAKSVPDNDDVRARLFFEMQFTPFKAHNRDDATGMFTGYYEPLLKGSLQPTGPYQVPLHARPDDLITVELKDFRSDLRGRRIAGRLKGDRLVPYPERKKIVSGVLADRAKPLVWVDDDVSAFFLQIQGSGRVALASGGEMRVGYAATNGQPYTAIGRELIRRGAVTKETVSLQSIRSWLKDNPKEAPDVMALNKSYVFFRELKGEGPIGAQSVALTPERSLAVDRKYIPLGVPIWLEATAPHENPDLPDQDLRQLLVAQDTGGAIRGPVRGDVFWGFGKRAEEIAGRMKHQGSYYLLLPKTIARRIEATGEKKNAD